jgi:hypothetical protein
MRDEVDEREAQAQLFSLLGGGRTDRPDCLLDLAELDIEPDWEQEEEEAEPSLMVFLEQVSPIHRFDCLCLIFKLLRGRSVKKITGTDHF